MNKNIVVPCHPETGFYIHYTTVGDFGNNEQIVESFSCLSCYNYWDEYGIASEYNKDPE